MLKRRVASGRSPMIWSYNCARATRSIYVTPCNAYLLCQDYIGLGIETFVYLFFRRQCRVPASG
jgi:hypothetical protein